MEWFIRPNRSSLITSAALTAITATLAHTQVASAERPAVIWTRAGHVNAVLTVNESPTGHQLVTSAQDGTVKVWDAGGNMSYSLSRHGPAALSPDGTRIAAIALGLSGGINLRNLADGSLIRRVGSGAAFCTPAWSPDGAQVAEVGSDRNIRLWNTSTGTLARTLSGHTGAVRCVAWSSDGSFIVTGAGLQGTDNTARIWSPATGQVLHTLTGHSDYIFSLAISPDSQIVATGSGDHTIKLWEASSGALLRTLTGPQWPIYALAFSPNGQDLASVDIGGPLRVWRVNDGAELHSFPLPNGGRSVIYGDGGQTLLIGTGTGPIERRDATDGALLETVGVQHDELVGLRFSADERSLAYGHDRNPRPRITRVDATDGDVIDERDLDGYANSNGVVYSPDLSLAATLTPMNTDTQLWNCATGAPVRELSGHVSVIYASAFSPDGSLFATAGEYQSGLWNVATGGFVHWFLDELSSGSQSIAFSADGTMIAIGNRQFAQVFDVATAALLHEFTTTSSFLTAIALSDDGTRLAAASEEATYVWRLPDETLLWSDPSPLASGEGLLFSHDGQRLYSAGRFDGIQIRAASNGNVLKSFDEEIGASITSLALSPSERNFAYTRTDATIVVAQNPFWTTGDTNADGCVDLTDLAALLSDFGLPNAPGRADFNDDGRIDLSDLAVLLAGFGAGCL